MNCSHVTTLYVHQVKGRDDYSGLYPKVNAIGDGPLATVKQALMRIRELREAGYWQPLVLRLLGGSYYLENTMELDAALGDLTIEGDTPDFLLSGGTRISGFVPDHFNGQACVSVDLPAVRDGWRFIDLYVGERRATLTRYPVDGSMLYAESVENPGRDFLHDHSKWFIARPGDLDNVTVSANTQLGYTHLWIDEHTPITNYDPATRRVDMKYISRFMISGEPGQFGAMEYWLENLPECLVKAGQWYLDGDAGRLYYIPTEDDPAAADLVAYAPRLRHLAVVSGKNIVLRGLTLAHTDGDYISRDFHMEFPPEGECCASDCQSVCAGYGAVEFLGATNCRVEGCCVAHYGVHGMAILDGCHGISIKDCRFLDGGAGGVLMNGGVAGSDPATHTYGNTIVNNVMDGLGRRYAAGCGILLRHTYENLLSHNTIRNCYYSGISTGWVWGFVDNISRDNIIEYNHIYNIGGGLLSDMGGIYLLGMQPGTIVRGNRVHDVTCKHYGGWGIYSDEGSSYQLYENNVVYNCKSNAYVLHFGRMNVMRNNILITGSGEVARATRTQMHVGTLLEHNIMVSDGGAMYQLNGDGGGVDYAAANLSYAHMTGRRNLLFNRTGETVVVKTAQKALSLGDMQAIGLEEDSIVADPLFVDAANSNFNLRPDSPALAMGFVPWDMENVGAKE